MKTIELIVSTSGQTRLETKGFAGRACLDATRQLETALGAKRSEQLTGEFYAAAELVAQDRARARGGEG